MAKLKDQHLGCGVLKRVTFDRKKRDGTVVHEVVDIRILRKKELDRARIQAELTTDLLLESRKDGRTREELLQDQRVVEVLAIALCDPESKDADKPEPWSTPMEIDMELSTEEIGFLWKHYEEWQEEQGPGVHGVTPEQYEAFLKTAGGSNADFLVSCAWPIRKAFFTTTAKELLSLREENSSLTLRLSMASTGSSSDTDESPTLETSDPTGSESTSQEFVEPSKHGL